MQKTFPHILAETLSSAFRKLNGPQKGNAPRPGTAPLPVIFGSQEEVMEFISGLETSLENSLSHLPVVPGLGSGIIFPMTGQKDPHAPGKESPPPNQKDPHQDVPVSTAQPKPDIVLAKIFAFDKTMPGNQLNIYDDKAVLIDGKGRAISEMGMSREEFIALSLEFSFIDMVSDNVSGWLGRYERPTDYTHDTLRLLMTEDEVGDVDYITAIRLIDENKRAYINVIVQRHVNAQTPPDDNKSPIQVIREFLLEPTADMVVIRPDTHHSGHGVCIFQYKDGSKKNTPLNEASLRYLTHRLLMEREQASQTYAHNGPLNVDVYWTYLGPQMFVRLPPKDRQGG